MNEVVGKLNFNDTKVNFGCHSRPISKHSLNELLIATYIATASYTDPAIVEIREKIARHMKIKDILPIENGDAKP